MRGRDRDLSLFAVVAPGLEGVARQELQRHGFTKVAETAGGCFFEGSALRANRVLAVPSRILERVARFRARTFPQLVEGAAAVDWSRYGGLTPSATAKKSRLYHTGAVEERLSQVIPPGPVALHCRLNRDTCDLSVDTSGERLHRRGWRIDNGPAPLRETLAAGVLALAGWTPGEALHDPMCGAGTFLIEAVSAAAGLAPGRLRTFACEAWLPAEPMPELAAIPTAITGSDASAAAVEATQRNAERAGVTIPVTATDVADLTLPGAGLLVCNPPYGKRARGTLDALVEAIRRHPTWRAAVLAPTRDLAQQTGRRQVAQHRLKNGGITVHLTVLAAAA